MRINKIVSSQTVSPRTPNYSSKNNKSFSAAAPQMTSLPIMSAPILNMVKPYRSLSFMGKTVHIVDGGNNAANMQHFANAISNEMDIEMHDVQTNSSDDNLKQLKSLEVNLKKLADKDVSGSYIAIPALATVPISNLQDQYNMIMGDDKKFTSANLKNYKENLLMFLKKIYENPEKCSRYISYMDPMGQGMQYAYGVIEQINKLVKKGAKVYVPSAHMYEQTIKWNAYAEDFEPELYHYIATGDDKDDIIRDKLFDIKRKNCYDFNLLALSDAHVVGVRGQDDAFDYIFAGSDDFVTDKERGVYNFTPIRKDKKIVGYSYTDTKTNQYPYNEFPFNDKIASIAKFVGQNCKKIIATEKEINELKNAIENKESTEKCADKLYPIEKIFSKEEIEAKRYDLEGKYVDRTLQSFFDVNDNHDVVFPKFNCEGTRKPSVFPMWGSCFSIFNAIQRDILKTYRHENRDVIEEHGKLIQEDIKKAQEYIQSSQFSDAEILLKEARRKDEKFAEEHPEYIRSYLPDKLLGDIYYDRPMPGRCLIWAEIYYCNALCILSKQALDEIRDVDTYGKDSKLYHKIKLDSVLYDFYMDEYNNAGGPIFKFFLDCPTEPRDYNKHKSMPVAKQVALIETIRDLLSRISIAHREDDEMYEAKLFDKARFDIEYLWSHQTGSKVLSKCAQNNCLELVDLGDLYYKIKPEQFKKD